MRLLKSLRPCPTVARAAIGFAIVAFPALARLAVAQADATPRMPANAPRSTADVAAATMPATVTILAIGASGDTLAQGSGFLVRENGVVVTNFHVLRGASGAIVILATKEEFRRVLLLDADSTLDLALLKIPGAGLPTLPVRTTTPRVGETAIAIGSPLGLSQTVSTGIVSALRVADGREFVQITTPISHGSSGGAVVDSDGRVFGVTTSQISNGQQLNFAVPVRYAIGLLGDHSAEKSIAEVFGGTSHLENNRSQESRASDARSRSVLRAYAQPRSSESSLLEREIAAVRAVFQEVTRDADARRLVARDTLPRCRGDHLDESATVWVDRSGRVRQLTFGGATEDHAETVNHYYDSSGRLRFVYVTRAAANGSGEEERVYFAGDGRRLQQITTLTRGPGYPFHENAMVWDPAEWLRRPCSPDR